MQVHQILNVIVVLLLPVIRAAGGPAEVVEEVAAAHMSEMAVAMVEMLEILLIVVMEAVAVPGGIRVTAEMALPRMAVVMGRPVPVVVAGAALLIRPIGAVVPF
jgi:hypothetical protein